MPHVRLFILFRRWWPILTLLLLPHLAIGSTPSTLPLGLQTVLKKYGVSPQDIGLDIQPIYGQYPAIAFNSTQMMRPASVAKLATTILALDQMGPNFSWNTRVFIDGFVSNHTLYGNLILVGDGDPKITVEAFELLLNRIQQHGIEHIRGDIILDRTRFQAPLYHPDHLYDTSLTEPYNVLPDPLLLNFKSIEIRIAANSSKTSSEPGVIVSQQLPFQDIELKNHLRVSQGRCRNWRKKIHLQPTLTPQKAVVRITGTYSKHCKMKKVYLSLLTPRHYADNFIRASWKKLGGTFTGQVVFRDQPTPHSPHLKYVLSHQSPPLSQIIQDINIHSNNVMARQLFLSFGLASHLQAPLNLENSRKTFQNWLQKRIQYPLTDATFLDNGSGLSRKSRLSPRILVRILKHAYHAPFRDIIIDSLPRPGSKGTLRYRLSNLPTHTQASLKTGTLNYTSSLAGYLKINGRMFCVAIIANSPKVYRLASAVDAVLLWSIQHLQNQLN